MKALVSSRECKAPGFLTDGRRAISQRDVSESLSRSKSKLFSLLLLASIVAPSFVQSERHFRPSIAIATGKISSDETEEGWSRSDERLEVEALDLYDGRKEKQDVGVCLLGRADLLVPVAQMDFLYDNPAGSQKGDMGDPVHQPKLRQSISDSPPAQQHVKLSEACSSCRSFFSAYSGRKGDSSSLLRKAGQSRTCPHMSEPGSAS